MFHEDRRAPGIRARHSRRCAKPAAGCTCKPAYQASVFDPRSGRKIRKTFPTLSAARGWQRDGVAAVARGELRPPTKTTVAEACAEVIDGVRSGAVRNRSGETFKPSAVRTYEIAVRRHIVPQLGYLRLSELRRADVQRFVERLNASR